MRTKRWRAIIKSQWFTKPINVKTFYIAIRHRHKHNFCDDPSFNPPYYYELISKIIYGKDNKEELYRLYKLILRKDYKNAFKLLDDIKDNLFINFNYVERKTANHLEYLLYEKTFFNTPRDLKTLYPEHF